MTIRQAIALSDAQREARVILTHLLNLSMTELIMRNDRELSAREEALYLALLEQRKQGIPLAYLLGHEDFYGREFKVTEDTLIPRPETEMLVEKVKYLSPESVLDLCTGSGILAVTLQKELGCDMTAVDVSKEALKIAMENAKLHGASVHWFLGDLFDPILESFDVIVSNPPYIDSEVLKGLEVSKHEPALALDGGVGGLEIYKRLIPLAADHLNRHGYLVLEIGYDQAQAITQMLKEAGFEQIEVTKDLAGFDRMVTARVRKQ